LITISFIQEVEEKGYRLQRRVAVTEMSKNVPVSIRPSTRACWDVVMFVTSLQQMWWCSQHLYSRCGDVCNIFTADVMMFVTSLQQIWWCS